jgi:hypothetical protein
MALGVIAFAPSAAHATNSVPCNGSWDFVSVTTSGGNRYCWANPGIALVALYQPRQFCSGNNTVTFGVLVHWYSLNTTPVRIGSRYTCIYRNDHSLQSIKVD